MSVSVFVSLLAWASVFVSLWRLWLVQSSGMGWFVFAFSLIVAILAGLSMVRK